MNISSTYAPHMAPAHPDPYWITHHSQVASAKGSCDSVHASCRERVQTEGRASVGTVRHTLQHQQLVDEVKAASIKAGCWDTMSTSQAVVVPVSQTCLATGLGEFEPTQEMTARFAIQNLGSVQNMPVRKLSVEEARRLQQVSGASLLFWVSLVARQGHML